MSFPSIVELNVGGKHFMTTLSTLLKDPESMLSAMFSGRHVLDTDRDGRYFIDRDGEHFQYLLNFLRQDEICLPDEPVLLTDLLREARYFQIASLVHILEKKLKQLYEPHLTHKDLVFMLNTSSNQLLRSALCLPGFRIVGLTLSYLDLTGSMLKGCNLSKTTLSEVNLSNVDMSYCKLKQTVMKNCIMRHTIIHHTNCTQANFTGSIMRNAICTESNFTSAKLSGTDCRGADWTGSNLSSANFLVANLEGCKLASTVLKGTSFEGANLKGVQGLTFTPPP
mmetsp:Transcript_7564/g.14098  ORF Transcript_7564/g.14098 Transcript_7564/m.14098 type:complete len:281 (-) Transcript_7564:1937-2779(-)